MKKDYFLASFPITNWIATGFSIFLVAFLCIATTTVVAQTTDPTQTCNFLKKIGGATSANGSEIAAYDPTSQRVYTVAGPVIEYFNMDNAGALTYGGSLPFGFTPPAGSNVLPNSVAVKNGILAAGYAIVTMGTNAQQQGRVTFYNSVSGAVLNSVTVGYLPDMITFTADGNKLLTANEGEPNSYNQGTSFDPEGSVSIIDLSFGVGSASVQTVGFTSYNGQAASLKAQGVRLFGPNATVAQDFEPEYIGLSPDGLTAWITLQENNAVAVLDIASASFTQIFPLGLKNHNKPTVRGVEIFELTDLPLAGTTPAGQSITLSGFSGLQFEGYAANGNLKFITHTDRGPNAEPTGINRPFMIPTFTPEIVRFELNRSSGVLTITERIQLKGPASQLLSGLPNISLGSDPNQAYNDEVPVDLLNNVIAPLDPIGGDMEGIYKAADGTFWMVDEYRPAIYHFTTSGVLIKRYVPIGTAAAAGMPAGTYGMEVLPAVIAQRRQNRGFEAIAFQNGKIYAFVQSPIRNPSTLSSATLNGLKNCRVIEFDPATETTTGQFVYILDNPVSVSPTDTRADKIGDAVAIENNEFLVIERDDDSYPTDPVADIQKKIYRFSLTGATNIHGLPNVISGKTVEQMTPAEMTLAGITPIRKNLHIDLAQTAYNARQKFEGLTIIDRNTIGILNDNDFGVAGAVINFTNGTFTPDPNAETSILGLIKIQNNGYDASDRDVNGTEAGGGKINIRYWPVMGMYMPDAISSFEADGQTYYVTANEGDSRSYTGYNEEIRVGAGAYVLDPTTFPNAAFLKLNANLGRHQITNATGNLDMDNDFDQIHAYGSRSFSIWNASGQQVYDSGDDLEQITAVLATSVFNSDGVATATTLPNGLSVGGFDTRSDNKGPETEAVTTGVVNGKTYAFVGSERTGDIFVYDISNPVAPVFVQYINTPEDIGLEGLQFVSAENSPTGRPLVITASEVSFTVGVFEINAPGSCDITAVPNNNIYTGGIPTNLYIGYGPQQLTLNVSAAPPSNGEAYTYTWTGDGTLSNYNIANPVFTATTEGSYTFTVSVSTECDVVTTCSITICVTDVRVPGQAHKVYLCHNGNNQAVSVNAVPTHLLSHTDDRLGSCDEAPCGSESFAFSNIAEHEIDLTDGIGLIAYPNPSNDQFTIHLHNDGSEDVEIRVMDLQGKIVYAKQAHEGEHEHSFGEYFPTGMFILEVKQGDESHMIKLVKQ